MDRWLHLSLVVALLALGGAFAGSAPATARQSSAAVGVVVNEDGNSLAMIDPASHAISSNDLEGALRQPTHPPTQPAMRGACSWSRLVWGHRVRVRA